jgi:hypothetical protein
MNAPLSGNLPPSIKLVTLLFLATLALYPITPTTCYLPAGVSMLTRLEEDIVSQEVLPGDAFHATVREPVSLTRNGPILINRDSIIVIRIESIVRAGRLKGVESMALRLETIVLMPQGQPHPIDASIKEIAVNGLRIKGNSIRREPGGKWEWLKVAVFPPYLFKRGAGIVIPKETQLIIKLLTPIEGPCSPTPDIARPSRGWPSDR